MGEVAAPLADTVLDALPHPVMTVAQDGMVCSANAAAETFFQMSRPVLLRHTLCGLLTPDTKVWSLVEKVMERGFPMHEYGTEVAVVRTNNSAIMDVYAAPLNDGSGNVSVMLQERGIADKISRQLSAQESVRTAAALSAMLAHEIKNPLSGIRGAAQLLEQSVGEEDHALTRLICDEADRIVKLVDRFEVFTDERPIETEPVNIHVILEHVRRLAQTGCAKSIVFTEAYDPSLPPVMVNRDQMVQVLLNLIKNAAEALEGQADGAIALSTAFRPGVRLALPGKTERVSLPLEITIRDNGPGIAPDIRPHLFDPFITTKLSGSGLGLALTAKIIRDHGGTIEAASVLSGTAFRILLPLATCYHAVNFK